MNSLIDYYGESSETENKPSSFQGIKEYWRKAYQSKTGGVYQWSMKDQALLSRLIKEYSTEDIVPMMDHYFRYIPKGYTFGKFFVGRATAYNELNKPDDYGFN